MIFAARRPGHRHPAPLAMIVVLAALSTAAAPLPDRGTQADQDACTPDVFKLCSDFIPDEGQIVACLKSKREQLSPACGNVFGAAGRLRRHHRQTPS